MEDTLQAREKVKERVVGGNLDVAAAARLLPPELIAAEGSEGVRAALRPRLKSDCGQNGEYGKARMRKPCALYRCCSCCSCL
jgi:hypothetical protein